MNRSLIHSITSYIEQTLPDRDNGIHIATLVCGGCRDHWRILNSPDSLVINELSEEDCLVVVAEESIHTS